MPANLPRGGRFQQLAVSVISACRGGHSLCRDTLSGHAQVMPRVICPRAGRCVSWVGFVLVCRRKSELARLDY